MLFVAWLGQRLGLPVGQTSSICALLVGVNGLCVLVLLCWPLSKLRLAVVALMGAGFFGATSLFSPLFNIQRLTAQSWGIVCGVGAALPLILCALVFLASLVKGVLRRREQLP